jgi:uncharacterized damage-inducible protein DinB
MQTEQAKFLLDFLLPQVEHEAKTTRRVIEAVPADKGDYRPEPVSRKALELAWHIAASEVWFLNGVANADFAWSGEDMPAEIKTPADIGAWYDKNLTAGVAKVKALSGEQLTKEVPFFGIITQPNVSYLQFMIKHSVHHRGQLCAYLRPMGSKVPDVYGGSADEPFQASAA